MACNGQEKFLQRALTQEKNIRRIFFIKSPTFPYESFIFKVIQLQTLDLLQLQMEEEKTHVQIRLQNDFLFDKLKDFNLYLDMYSRLPGCRMDALNWEIKIQQSNSNKTSSDKGPLRTCHTQGRIVRAFQWGKQSAGCLGSEKDPVSALHLPVPCALCPPLPTSRSQGQAHRICPHLVYPSRLSLSVHPRCYPSLTPNCPVSLRAFWRAERTETTWAASR